VRGWECEAMGAESRVRDRMRDRVRDDECEAMPSRRDRTDETEPTTEMVTFSNTVLSHRRSVRRSEWREPSRAEPR